MAALDISHFTMVGFAINTHDQASLVQTTSQLLPKCEMSKLSDRNLVCFIKDQSGAELRIGLLRDVSGQAEIATMGPSFSGEGRTSVDVVGDVSDPADKPFEVSISAHFSGDKTPIIFELADPSEAEAFVAGKTLAVDITVFGFEPQIYADANAFIAAQKKDHPKLTFSPEFFVPSGTFYEKVGGAMPYNAKRPVAYADLAGKVLKSDLRTNAVGTRQFWWATIATYDGSIMDVVMDPRSVAMKPAPGTIVTGRFWLTARLSRHN